MTRLSKHDWKFFNTEIEAKVFVAIVSVLVVSMGVIGFTAYNLGYEDGRQDSVILDRTLVNLTVDKSPNVGDYKALNESNDARVRINLTISDSTPADSVG